ncbi:hypothetical protein ACIO6U_03910 [Streptomyces sp. NPDC087422]|uniref:hypothetical protein n=1 Tax=Streptomyces sp. NPDC087422 TaxID=3365786 RepID=UPI00381B55F7
MDENLAPPLGWRYAAYPWFARDDAPDLPRLVRVGPVLLPEFFHLVIATQDAWLMDSSGIDWVDSGECALFLDFQIFEGRVEMPHALTVFDDLPRVLDRVRKVVAPSKWKRLGIHYMVQYLTDFMDEGGQPDGDPSTRRSIEKRDPYGAPPKAALEWLERLQDQASEAYAEAREMSPPRRKRTRITDEHLHEVAQVYRMADNMGVPPTREVANHFKAPHSTAAKWVASARRKKFLPPANTPPQWGPYGEPSRERLAEVDEELEYAEANNLSPLQVKMLEEERAELRRAFQGQANGGKP